MRDSFQSSLCSCTALFFPLTVAEVVLQSPTSASKTPNIFCLHLMVSSATGSPIGIKTLGHKYNGIREVTQEWVPKRVLPHICFIHEFKDVYVFITILILIMTKSSLPACWHTSHWKHPPWPPCPCHRCESASDLAASHPLFRSCSPEGWMSCSSEGAHQLVVGTWEVRAQCCSSMQHHSGSAELVIPGQESTNTASS